MIKITLLLLLFLLLLSSSLSSVCLTIYASSSSDSISSEGCDKGHGYYADDPDPICEPFDRIGKGPPPNTVFCSALGCPYNPPNLPGPSIEEPQRNEVGSSNSSEE
jgi:hypothetical protein